MSRGLLYTFLVAALAGLGMGLYFGWVVSPVEYVNSDPSTLQQEYKDDYVLMIATLYSQDGNLEAAHARLAQLGFSNPGQAVAQAAQRFIAAQRPEAGVRRIVALAAALNALPTELIPYAPDSAGQTRTAP